MFQPIKVIDLELTQPLPSVGELTNYGTLQALLRWHGVPLGWVRLPVMNGGCTATALGAAILAQQSQAILRQARLYRLESGRCNDSLQSLLQTELRPAVLAGSKVTVAVCTRNRAADLQRCLEALSRLTYEAELLVVDNAPASDATKTVVAAYPQVRYVKEPRPGLDWARNRAILEATGEIIAFTDDDVVVDPNWVSQLVRVFDQHPEVMAVTGLVVPAELETQAQVWFEQNGGFGKGWQRRQWQFPDGQMHWTDLGTGNLGTGANMAFRRALFRQIGGFDPALDVGTVTNGAGDLELFFRVLKAGHAFVYEPAAIVWHHHRRDYAALRSQLRNNGSVYASFIRSALAYPETARSFLRLGLSWFWHGHLCPSLTSLFYPASFPADLRWAQLWGCCIGLTTYFQAQRQAAAIAAQFGELQLQEQLASQTLPMVEPPSPQRPGIAVRTLELSQPLAAMTDVAEFAQTRLFVMQQGSPLGSVDIANCYQSLSVGQISEAVIQQLGWRLERTEAALKTEMELRQLLLPDQLDQREQLDQLVNQLETRLPAEVAVSIIIGTYDRPADLRNCLQHLLAQESPRPVEIIVVDNHPASGLTAPVVTEFPQVKLVSEVRQGVAYARNAGITVSRGQIIVTVDDDVSMPPDWLEKLLAPLARADVMAVTGNVLPVELDTESQQLFEQYGNGGLGRGFTCFEADSDWFNRSWMHAVPTWELGGTANSAYRAALFRDPQIGLMDEALGPGMPSGVGEDIYLFYKILKAGGVIFYQAQAYVWHRHRRELPALKRQLHNYSKGFVAYHLTTLLHDRDYRALLTLLIFLPLYHLKQLGRWIKGERFYPLALIGVEVTGNLAGARALWQSRQRVRQLGKSAWADYSTTGVEPLKLEIAPAPES